MLLESASPWKPSGKPPSDAAPAPTLAHVVAYAIGAAHMQGKRERIHTYTYIARTHTTITMHIGSWVRFAGPERRAQAHATRKLGVASSPTHCPRA